MKTTLNKIRLKSPCREGWEKPQSQVDQQQVIAAQRKVLEQAGDALSRFVYVECDQLSHRWKKEMHDFDKPCPIVAKVQAAITAIKEQLKCSAPT